jgi:hypothetical protein
MKDYKLPIYANERGDLGTALAPALKTLSDLCTFSRDSDPLALLQSTAGEFASDMSRIFPDEWAWAAVAAPRSTRQIWFALLSGFATLPTDCARLRSNLLTVDLGLMLRLRFGDELSVYIGNIVSRLDRYPLQRGLYDKLARILVADPTVITWYEGRPGIIETDELSELVSQFRLEPILPAGDGSPEIVQTEVGIVSRQ